MWLSAGGEEDLKHSAVKKAVKLNSCVNIYLAKPGWLKAEPWL